MNETSFRSLRFCYEMRHDKQHKVSFNCETSERCFIKFVEGENDRRSTTEFIFSLPLNLSPKSFPMKVKL